MQQAFDSILSEAFKRESLSQEPCQCQFANSLLELDQMLHESRNAQRHGLLQAMDKLMPGFDSEIAKLAQRVLVNPRHIDWHTGVLATKVTPGTPSASWTPCCLCEPCHSECDKPASMYVTSR